MIVLAVVASHDDDNCGVDHCDTSFMYNHAVSLIQSCSIAQSTIGLRVELQYLVRFGTVLNYSTIVLHYYSIMQYRLIYHWLTR